MASAATEQQQEQSSSDDRRARFYEAKAQVASAISRQLKPPATAPGVSAGPDAALHPSLLNDASVIEPGLILSSWNVERSAELLQHLGVASVLQIGSELSPSHMSSGPLEGRIKYLCIKIPDVEVSDLVTHLPACLAYLEGEHAKKRTVLVHCAAGISRSASVVVGYLIWSQGLSYEAALARVRDKRPFVLPNRGFRLQLLEFERLCREGSLPRGDTLSLEAAMRVHWRPWNRLRMFEAKDEEAQQRLRAKGAPDWMDTDS